MIYEEYKNLFELEGAYWRYAGLREIVKSILNSLHINRNQTNILDAGCGTGMVLLELKKYGRSIGIDISEYALYFCRRRNLPCLSRASITALPFKENYFGVIVSLDVIYHQYVDDDYKALSQAYRVLKKGGRIVISVPAYNFLKSTHDEVVYTRHRYTKDELRRKLEESGFIIEKITYWNTFLFPLIAFVKIIKKTIKRDACNSDLKVLPHLINKALTKIIIFESRLLKNINFPYGISIIAVARK